MIEASRDAIETFGLSKSKANRGLLLLCSHAPGLM